MTVRIRLLSLCLLAGTTLLGAPGRARGLELLPALLPPAALAPCSLTVTSDPPIASVTIDSSETVLKTPVTLSLPRGRHAFSVAAIGHATLDHEAVLQGGGNTTLHFVLGRDEPMPPAPEELGLAFVPVPNEIPEEESDRVRKRLHDLAATFAVFPLGQGLMGKLAFRPDNNLPFNEFILVGATLTLTAYIAGKLLASRSLDRIREENDARRVSQVAAQKHNQDVSRTLDQKYSEMMSEWQLENSGRGRVVTTERPRPTAAAAPDSTAAAPDSTAAAP